MRIPGCIALISMTIGTIGAGFADDDPGYKNGPWHYKSVSCVDTTVTEVTPRLENAGQTTFTAKDLQETGVIVSFKTGLGVAPLFAKDYAAVVHYQNETANDVMAAEHAGDRVRRHRVARVERAAAIAAGSTPATAFRSAFSAARRRPNIAIPIKTTAAAASASTTIANRNNTGA